MLVFLLLGGVIGVEMEFVEVLEKVVLLFLDMEGEECVVVILEVEVFLMMFIRFLIVL